MCCRTRLPSLSTACLVLYVAVVRAPPHAQDRGGLTSDIVFLAPKRPKLAVFFLCNIAQDRCAAAAEGVGRVELSGHKATPLPTLPCAGNDASCAGLWRRQCRQVREQVEAREVSGELRSNAAPVEALVLPLPGLAAADSPALHVLAKHCGHSVMQSQSMRTLLDFKWEHYGRRHLLRDLTAHVALTGVYSCLVSLRGQKVGPAVASHEWGNGETVLFTLAFLFNLNFLRGEAMQLCRSGVRRYLHPRKAHWNYIDQSIIWAVFAALGLMRTQPAEGWRGVSAVATVLLWFKLLFFARGDPRTGPFLRMVHKMVEDMSFFLLILSATVVGFSFAFFQLYSPDSCAREPECKDMFGSIGITHLTVIRMMLGDFDITTMTASSKSPGLVTALFILFVVACTVILLNLLIALMGDTFGKVSEDLESHWRVEQAAIILDIETSMHVIDRRREHI